MTAEEKKKALQYIRETTQDKEEKFTFGKYSKQPYQVGYLDKGYVKWSLEHLSDSNEEHKKWLKYIIRQIEQEQKASQATAEPKTLEARVADMEAKLKGIQTAVMHLANYITMEKALP